MRDWLRVAAIPVLVAPACLPTLALGQSADSAFFEEALTPYGDWMEVSGYGACWHPDVELDWAPYTNGYWAYTDVGWTWVSHEPFGSIVFHYGRWLLTSAGWCWVPGADWAPAWVSWRRGGDYVGWAPLPPEVPWHSQRGIGTWVDVHTEIGPAYYRFCEVRSFCSPVLTEVVYRPTQNLAIMLRTENVTNMWARNNVVVCGGPEYRWIRERAVAEVPVLRVVREENIKRYYSINIGGNFGTVQNIVYGDNLVLPAPSRVEVQTWRRNRALPTAEVSVSRGWYGDAGANARLRSHLSQEWDRRESDPRRGSGAVAPQTLEVQVKPVTNSERLGLVAEVAAGGVIAPPSAQRPMHPSFVPDRTQGGLGSDRSPGSSTRRAASAELSDFAKSPNPPSPRQVLPSTGGIWSSNVDPRPSGLEQQRSRDSNSSNPPAVEPARREPLSPLGGLPPSGVLSGNGSPTLPSGSPVSAGTARAGVGGVRQPRPVTGGTVSNSGASSGPQAQRPQVLPRGDVSPFSGRVNQGNPNPGIPVGSGIPGANPLPQNNPLPPAVSGAPSVQGAFTPPTRRSNPNAQNSAPQAPPSGARMTVIPAATPAPVVPQASQSSAAPGPSFGQGNAMGGGAPARGPAPASNVAPTGSGASISTTPASGAPAQPAPKKKPGDPGYVPPSNP